MKIEKIAFNPQGNIELTHPGTDEPLIAEDDTPMSVTVFGNQSKEFRAAKDKMLDNQIGKKGMKTISAGQIEQAKLTMLVDCTVSFNGVDFGDGPLDVKNAKKHYVKHPWFRDQVDVGLGETERFLMKDAPKSKKP